MIHPHTELRYINDQIGFGVFATKLIPKGTITWALDELDQKLDPKFVNSTSTYCQEIIKKYAYRNQDGLYILCWDLGRYVNHSFHANCMGTAYEFEIAVRDIYPGEELTDDYGTLNIEEPFACLPEKGTDRKIVYPDDLLYFHEEWDQQVLEASQHFDQVEQPLLSLVRPGFIGKFKQAATNLSLQDSIKAIYYNQQK
ncbi:MAG: SET domain-containing protein [Paenisporosarcina sp.]